MRLEEIENSQQIVLTKIESIEANQKEIGKEIEDENPNLDDDEIFSCDL